MSTPLGQITGLDKYKEAANPNRGGLGMFNAAFGNSAEKFSQGRELDEDGEIKANWKDRLFGHSTEELTEEYYKRRAKALKLDPRAEALRAEGKDIAVETTGAQLQKQTNDLNKLTEARKAAANAGFLELATLDDPNAIRSGIVKKTEQKAKDTKTEEREYAQSLVKAANARADGLLKAANARADSKERIARQDRLAREKLARMDNLTLRQDNLRAENRRYELQMLQMQQADKQKAQDRRDRMIMTLMQGLNNLGSAFTI